MNHTLQTTKDIEQAFTTELTKIQEQILTFVEDMQPVCRKVVKLNAGSYADSTITENIRELIDMGQLATNDRDALVLDAEQ